ncbi:hypothetical protein IWX49DRAFT_385261 [Phyllosticta citricarpa]|uniref:Zn(2)-C6 fungal-type domain-containing protein n=1 Tax=Phyllosticta citricarpa TaxID=55181 RepID=A0ABR1L5Q1_9PEZI
MVYCGKPSKGCHTCRQRKIRCDQQPDGCSQCAKSRRTCPGYRSQLDVMFRNESTRIEKRVKARAKVTRNAVPASDSASPNSSIIFEAGSGSSPTSSSPASTDYALVQPSFEVAPTSNVDELATGYFTSSHCSHVFFGPNTGVFSAKLADPWITDITPGLLHCMKAVGLSGLSRLHHDQKMLNRAWGQYAEAIRLTNQALASPTEALKDGTLLSVIILGVYESSNGRTRQSLDSWAAHISGAAALLSLRGRRQVTTAVGRRMFFQVTSNMLINCIQKDIPFPKEVAALMDSMREARQSLSNAPDPSQPIWRLRELMVELANFRAGVFNKTMSDPHEIIARCIEFDTAILSNMQTFPSDVVFTRVYTDADPDIVLYGFYDIYPDFWMVQTFNTMRNFRILLHSMIRATLLRGFSAKPPVFTQPEYTRQLQLTVNTLYGLQADLCASVPQQIGYVSKARRQGHSPLPQHHKPWLDFENDILPESWQIGTEHMPIIRSSGNNLLNWSLFMIVNMDITTEKTRDWVIDRLEETGSIMGMHHGTVLAKFVRDLRDANSQQR